MSVVREYGGVRLKQAAPPWMQELAKYPNAWYALTGELQERIKTLQRSYKTFKTWEDMVSAQGREKALQDMLNQMNHQKEE